jgi:serine/threonine-protein kinase
MGAADRSPLVLGRYALFDRIASGGMASVHLGRLLGPVGFARTVAIKRLHAQFAEDPEFVSMFMDEARLAGRISHPNVVPTLDVVATGRELFLVMEYVRGESLARLLRAAWSKGDSVPHAITSTITGGVLHGLHAAHEATNEHGEPLSLVHRDVSPQNVLVGIDGVPRVLDFGVAKAVGRVHSTRNGQLKGKLAYMAPEQIEGKPVTRATDVYAVSIVLWEALTGQRLFAGEGEAETIHKALQGCRTAPSHFVPALPAALDGITMRGLSLDPKDRFPTAREMALALEREVPVVAASQIGDWVESLVAATLAQRNEQIASIESSSSAQNAAAAATAAAKAQALSQESTQVQLPLDARLSEDGITQLSSGSMSSPGVQGATAPRRHRRLLAMGAVATAAAGSAWVLFGHARPGRPIQAAVHVSAPAETHAASEPSSLATNDQVPPSPPLGTPDARSMKPIVAALETAPAQPPARGNKGLVRSPISSAAPAAPSRSAFTPPCTVLTDYDSDGQPHFRKVCK